MGNSNSATNRNLTNSNIANSTLVNNGNGDDSKGQLLICILVLTILSFMTLVGIHVIVEYWKYQNSINKLKRDQRRMGCRLTRSQSFKDELEGAVMRRKERLEPKADKGDTIIIAGAWIGAGDSADPDGDVNTFTSPSSNSSCRSTTKPLPTRRKNSDEDLDAIEEAPMETAV